jgi:endonuclease/exonuclease/phosphatase family metal-dependent hydrolase
LKLRKRTIHAGTSPVSNVVAPTPVFQAAALAAVLLLAGCAGTAATSTEARVPAGECAAPPQGVDEPALPRAVTWLVHSEPADRYELDEWCRGVGVPVIAGARTSQSVEVDSVAVVAWNIHLGAGRVDEFVAALRSGELTGGPATHFVLLLQEARRAGPPVPAVLPADGRAARRLGERDAGVQADIVATARRLGLHLFYVPSMRNGGRSDAAEDRGNAILSSLPLTEHAAIELPLLAQRRVAVAATVPLRDRAGRPRTLRVSSVHLDYGATMNRPFAPFGPGRTLQAGALADALAGPGNVVIGGDFNTWSLAALEGGLTIMSTRFADFPPSKGEATHYSAGLLPRRLDHLFLRSDDVRGSAPLRIADRWGSDHHPLLAWIRFPASTPLAGDPPRP